MNTRRFLMTVLLAGFVLIALMPDLAFAKRLGGGQSFGGRPSYSQSYRSGPEVSPAARSPQMAARPAAQQNHAMRESFRNRGGLMGMLGGLALGGLLGAMLFGGGFEQVNGFDLVAFGLVAYVLYRFLAARRRPEWSAETGPARATFSAAVAEVDPPIPQHRGMHGTTGAPFDTNLLDRTAGTAPLAMPGSAASTILARPPAGLDADAFLDAAKRAYRHLQKAWDERDLAELRALTTPSVFDELRQQLQNEPERDRTEVLSLEATLLDARELGSSTLASVMFDAMIRENGAAAPARVQEVWHFVRSSESSQPTWFLDGIQQVAV